MTIELSSAESSYLSFTDSASDKGRADMNEKYGVGMLKQRS